MLGKQSFIVFETAQDQREDLRLELFMAKCN